jgi:hypothetical protein
MVKWSLASFRQLDAYAAKNAPQFAKNYLTMTDVQKAKCKEELAEVWKVYLTGDYARLENVVFEHFPPLPSDVDKRTTYKALKGNWLGTKLTDEDLEGFTFTYPLRPDPKELGKALVRVGLCTAGNGMEVLHDDDAATALSHPAEVEYWEKRRKPPVPGMWRFFIDGTGPGSDSVTGTGTPPACADVLN